MGTAAAVILTQRTVDDLPFDPASRVHRISRTIARPREAFVFVGLR
jgi:hypothetical protein